MVHLSCCLHWRHVLWDLSATCQQNGTAVPAISSFTSQCRLQDAAGDDAEYDLVVVSNIVFKKFVWVGVKVHQIAFVALHHHACIGSSNAASSNNANSLALQQVAHKQVWKPALVLAASHEFVSLYNTAGCRKGKGQG